jgi:predicted Zn-dependent protease with MMP-like domain
MKRDRFLRLVREALDSLPAEFRRHIHNLAVLVEDRPAGSSADARTGHSESRSPASRRVPPPRSARPKPLLMGKFVGVPTIQKSIFDLPLSPNHVIIYQKNIEAVCSTDAEIREQVRRTVIHELGHYFGLNESQLWDV